MITLNLKPEDLALAIYNAEIIEELILTNQFHAFIPRERHWESLPPQTKEIKEAAARRLIALYQTTPK